MPKLEESSESKHFFEDSMKIFNMLVKGEINRDDLANSETREKILKDIEKNRPVKTLKNNVKKPNIIER
ncbi:MAG: hypothetical protein JW974_01480 [Alphaproteobacteria bacterium]|nr:hypothetical protein [Alphaproteobacteria bacterium]MBN2675454.1 hypothetical protein [Alphaproteobacteria bacterium]